MDYGETFVDHLQQSVGVGQGTRFINLGVPGSALPTQRSIVERRHDDLANPPTYLVFFFLGNDFSDLLRDVANENEPQPKQTRHEKKSAWRDLSAKMNAYVSASWLRHCYAIQFSKRALMRATNDTRRNPIFTMMESANSSYHRRVRDALRSELAAWGQIGQGDQFDIVVILIPDCHQVIPTRREELAGIVAPFQPNWTRCCLTES